MKRHIKKFTFFLLGALFLVSCRSSETAEEGGTAVDYADITKPEKVTIMANTFSKDEDTKEEIRKKFEKDTGIKLEINQIADGTTYYEQVNIALAADNQTDVVELGSVYYPSAAMYDLLWDMTDVFEVSDVKNVIDTYYTDALKIGGRLYGFPISRGNGTMTYVRKDWLDRLGLGFPKNYNEYYNMLKAFKNMGGDIIPITAAGLIGTEAPYRTYLPEFYQDANPDIYLKDGKFVDGMQEPAMKSALERMKQAYAEGLFDPDVTTNTTKDCREKVFAGRVAVFNYWAGNWANNLKTSLQEQQGESAQIVGFEPISEIKYIERPPVAIAIPKTCENPEGVFKYFIEYMHDADDGEILFSLGIEGKNYEVKNGRYDPILVGAWYTPELTLAKNPLPINIIDTVEESLELFNKNSVMEPLPSISEKSGGSLPEIGIIRKETIESVVTTDMTIDEGIKDYEKRASKLVERALSDLNGTDVEDEEKGEK